MAVEIKSGETIASDFFKGLRLWREMTGKPDAPCVLVHGGADRYLREGIVVQPWHAWP